MGYRRRIGFVREIEAYGGKMLRIDIPAEGGDITEFYGCASIYALRPVAEDVARDAARQHGDPRPARPIEYRIEDRTDRSGERSGYSDLDGMPL